MPVADLKRRQWELDGSLLMGRGQVRDGTSYIVGVPDWGEAENIGDPVPRPRADGARWGRGYRGGRVITLPITVDAYSEVAAREAASRLEAAWDAEPIRSVPNAVSVLRYNWAGSTRRVYGRAGKIRPVEAGMDFAGRIDYEAEFETQDHLFYGDGVETTVVPYVPTLLGGLVGPQTGGWAATTVGVASGRVTVGGSKPAWLVWTIRGPIVNPRIEVAGGWSATLETTVNYDQSVTVDPTPWNRSVRRNDGASLAGTLSAGSERLSRMRVPPGASQVLLRGIDPSGTSSLMTSVRSVHASY